MLAPLGGAVLALLEHYPPPGTWKVGMSGPGALRDVRHADAMLCRLVADHSCAIIGGMHNHAGSRASERALFVLIVSPESCSRARWDVENKPLARGAGASRYAPLVSWA